MGNDDHHSSTLLGTMEPSGDDNLATASPSTDVSFSDPLDGPPQSGAFHFFSKLPVEIRRMIWVRTTQSERVVEIQAKQIRNRQKNYELQYRSKTLVPALLHVNLESRSVGLSMYEPLYFNGRFTGTYINWERNFVFFSSKKIPMKYRVQWSNSFSLLISSSRRYRGKRINEELKEKCRKLAFDGDLRYILPLAKWHLKNLESAVSVLRFNMDDGDMELVPITDVDIAGYSEEDFGSYNHDLQALLRVQRERPSIKDIRVMNAVKHPYRGLKKGDKGKIKHEKIEFLNENGLTLPKKPVRAIFKNDKVASLKAKAKFRGLSMVGLKEDLLERLEAAEDARLAKAMEKYDDDLVEYWTVMEGFKQEKEKAPAIESEQASSNICFLQ